MIPMTLAEIAAAVGGASYGDPDTTISAPAFLDSRSPEPDGLFVAIAGERVDGHDYADKALAGGAAAVLGSRPTSGPTVVVDDPVVALGRLARHVRDRLDDLTVIAMTGSQGKTGTKDFLAQVLEPHGPTVATAGNLNNELGVPLTVLRATPHTRFLVVEMGARGIGHIGYLCEISRPTVAGVLNVGTAHMSEFGSREAIAVAKGEIIEGLPGDGTAVLNLDDELVAAMEPRTVAPVIGFGAGNGAGDVRPGAVVWTDLSTDALERPSATLHRDDESVAVSLQEIGIHQLANAAAAVALAVGAGIPFAAAAASVGRARSRSQWRMEVHDLSGDRVVINDAYNANPASMSAALETLGHIGQRRTEQGGRTIAVVGEMRELGSDTDHEHRHVGRVAAEQRIDVLIPVGTPADLAREGAASVTSWPGTVVPVADIGGALAWLRENFTRGDVLLIKASRAAALERVADGLINEEKAQ